MKRIGVGVGGSHVSASMIDFSKEGRQALHFHRKEIDSFGSSDSVIEAMGDCIKEAAITLNAGENKIAESQTSINNPKRWNIEMPNRYVVQTSRRNCSYR